MPCFRKALPLLLGLIGFGWACYDPAYVRFQRNNHVMCERPPAMCGGRKPDVDYRGFSALDKAILLHLMNKFRSLTATGRTPGYHPAAKMQQLIWDDELAKLAQRRTELCSFDTHYDARVGRFDVSQFMHEMGEVFSLGEDKGANIYDFAKVMFLPAFDNTYPAKLMGKYNSSHNKVRARPFTQLLWDRTRYVGCGYMYYGDFIAGVGYRRMACNFGPKGNVENEPVYEIGEPDCDRESKWFPGLCVTKEAEKKYEPLSCEDTDHFLLCQAEDANLFEWLGIEPYTHLPCKMNYWRSMVRWGLVALGVSVIIWILVYGYLFGRLLREFILKIGMPRFSLPKLRIFLV